MSDIHDYTDIIDMSRPQSIRHKPMSIRNRAAQFAPFAALNGHKESVAEKERLVEQRKVIDEHRKELLDCTLKDLRKFYKNAIVHIEYFQNDLVKNGGNYLIYEGFIYKINDLERFLVVDNNQRIYIEDIYDLHFVALKKHE